jgi:predicted Zn-dependent protease with MMP-like domain
VREALIPALRAAAATALVAALVVVLLGPPPSFARAGGIVPIVVGAVALALVTAWLVVALTGRHAMSEAEVERLVRRSERLARSSREARPEDAFDALVEGAIDRLPAEFRAVLEDTPVVVSHRGTEHRAYGQYTGDTVARDDRPDRIVIYRDTLERDFGHHPELLAEQVERTLRHELAHHLGWREEGVRELGL